ncbi:MAG: LCP family protein [Bacillaceae bacterium]
MEQQLRSNRRKRRLRKRRVFMVIMIPILIVILGIGTYGGVIYSTAKKAWNSSQEQLERGNKSVKRSHVVDPSKDNVSLLIVGVDSSEKRSKTHPGPERTDAMMVATFSHEDPAIQLVSIPRDTYTYIDVEEKKDKINHAHAFGGMDAAIDAVENLLDIPIDYYVKVNFDAFKDVVDTIGGIEVDVPVTFTEQNSQDQKGAITLKKGLQTLNGEQALALARTRKIDSDAMRGQRQMLVVDAIFKKLVSFKSITKAGNLIEAVQDDIHTNLAFNDMISFYKFGLKSGVKLERQQVEGYDEYINGIYYYVPYKQKLNSLQNHLKGHLGLKTE